jgi:glycosyltransferase involved in cell wall biosynthesis
MADARLKIAVDGRELIGKPTGVGRYLLEILQAWKRSSFPHRVMVITPSAPASALMADLPDIVWHVESARASGTRWEQGRLARALAKARPDVFFAPAYTAPLRLPCPMVVAIHDVSFFAHPEWFGRREGWRRRWLTRATARHARTVLTLSEFSRAEIERFLKVPASRVTLAPPGAPPQLDPSGIRREPLLLYVGSLFNRRHIADLIHAFALAAPRVPGGRLVLIGDNRTSPRIDPMAIATAAGIGDRVAWRAYETDAARDLLYQSARAFVYLSDYEGFGMPPIEAMAHDVPSVVLDTPISREIYGNAALTVPVDTRAIADAIVSLLTDDRVHARLVDAGRERLTRFSWAATAATVGRALEEAAR